MKVTLNKENLKKEIKRKIGIEINRRPAAKPWKHTNQLWNGQIPASWLYGSTNNYQPIIHHLQTDVDVFCSSDGVLSINLIFRITEEILPR